VFTVVFIWSARVGASALTGIALRLNKNAISKTRVEALAAFIA